MSSTEEENAFETAQEERSRLIRRENTGGKIRAAKSRLTSRNMETRQLRSLKIAKRNAEAELFEQEYSDARTFLSSIYQIRPGLQSRLAQTIPLSSIVDTSIDLTTNTDAEIQTAASTLISFSTARLLEMGKPLSSSVSSTITNASILRTEITKLSVILFQSGVASVMVNQLQQSNLVNILKVIAPTLSEKAMNNLFTDGLKKVVMVLHKTTKAKTPVDAMRIFLTEGAVATVEFTGTLTIGVLAAPVFGSTLAGTLGLMIATSVCQMVFYRIGTSVGVALKNIKVLQLSTETQLALSSADRIAEVSQQQIVEFKKKQELEQRLRVVQNRLTLADKVHLTITQLVLPKLREHKIVCAALALIGGMTVSQCAVHWAIQGATTTLSHVPFGKQFISLISLIDYIGINTDAIQQAVKQAYIQPTVLKIVKEAVDIQTVVRSIFMSKERTAARTGAILVLTSSLCLGLGGGTGLMDPMTALACTIALATALEYTDFSTDPSEQVTFEKLIHGQVTFLSMFKQSASMLLMTGSQSALHLGLGTILDAPIGELAGSISTLANAGPHIWSNFSAAVEAACMHAATTGKTLTDPNVMKECLGNAIDYLTTSSATWMSELNSTLSTYSSAIYNIMDGTTDATAASSLVPPHELQLKVDEIISSINTLETKVAAFKSSGIDGGALAEQSGLVASTMTTTISQLDTVTELVETELSTTAEKISEITAMLTGTAVEGSGGVEIGGAARFNVEQQAELKLYLNELKEQQVAYKNVEADLNAFKVDLQAAQSDMSGSLYNVLTTGSYRTKDVQTALSDGMKTYQKALRGLTTRNEELSDMLSKSAALYKRIQPIANDGAVRANIMREAGISPEYFGLFARYTSHAELKTAVAQKMALVTQNMQSVEQLTEYLATHETELTSFLQNTAIANKASASASDQSLPPLTMSDLKKDEALARNVISLHQLQKETERMQQSVRKLDTSLAANLAAQQLTQDLSESAVGPNGNLALVDEFTSKGGYQDALNGTKEFISAQMATLHKTREANPADIGRQSMYLSELGADVAAMQAKVSINKTLTLGNLRGELAKHPSTKDVAIKYSDEQIEFLAQVRYSQRLISFRQLSQLALDKSNEALQTALQELTALTTSTAEFQITTQTVLKLNECYSTLRKQVEASHGPAGSRFIDSLWHMPGTEPAQMPGAMALMAEMNQWMYQKVATYATKETSKQVLGSLTGAGLLQVKQMTTLGMQFVEVMSDAKTMVKTFREELFPALRNMKTVASFLRVDEPIPHLVRQGIMHTSMYIDSAATKVVGSDISSSANRRYAYDKDTKKLSVVSADETAALSESIPVIDLFDETTLKTGNVNTGLFVKTLLSNDTMSKAYVNVILSGADAIGSVYTAISDPSFSNAGEVAKKFVGTYLGVFKQATDVVEEHYTDMIYDKISNELVRLEETNKTKWLKDKANPHIWEEILQDRRYDNEITRKVFIGKNEYTNKTMSLFDSLDYGYNAVLTYVPDFGNEKLKADTNVLNDMMFSSLKNRLGERIKATIQGKPSSNIAGTIANERLAELLVTFGKNAHPFTNKGMRVV